MRFIAWEAKLWSIRSTARELLRASAGALDISTRLAFENAVNLARVVGQDIDNDLIGEWDDDTVEGDLPAVLYDWIVAGYKQDLYPDWEPAQLMAAYAFYMAYEAEYTLDEIAPEGAEGDDRYNYFGWTRESTIEHCAANLLAAMEAIYYGNKLLNVAIKHDPERLQSLIDQHIANINSKRASHAVNERHNKKGGSREKRERIRAIWASGKYSSRDICAEQECAVLGISFSTARKALRNTPDPNVAAT